MTDNLKLTYEELRGRFLHPVSVELETQFKQLLAGKSRIDRITARAKAVNRFLGKAAKTDDEGNLKYDDPIHQIQDIIGVRIITFYLSDVEVIAKNVCKHFRKIEEKQLVPDSADKFGYEGKHFILFIPRDAIDSDTYREDDPKFFELQIKTLFQHAWGEASHDLAYKAETELTIDQKRRVAFAAAQAWGGDMIFEGLANEIQL